MNSIKNIVNTVIAKIKKSITSIPKGLACSNIKDKEYPKIAMYKTVAAHIETSFFESTIAKSLYDH
jgi:hypothetical protein